VSEAPIRDSSPETGGYGLSGARSRLLLGIVSAERFLFGGRGRVPCCPSAWRCPRGTAGRRPCRPVYE
jgi:hypothetical protein